MVPSRFQGNPWWLGCISVYRHFAVRNTPLQAAYRFLPQKFGGSLASSSDWTRVACKHRHEFPKYISTITLYGLATQQKPVAQIESAA